MLHQKLSTNLPTEFRGGTARYVYLIKRSDGMIKVGVSRNVRKRRSHLAQASPEALSVLKIIEPGKALAFHVESAIKTLLRPLQARGEWFNCSDALALLALRAAEHGELECRACVVMEIERLKLRWGADTWIPTTCEMWRRFPEYMRETDPWSEDYVNGALKARSGTISVFRRVSKSRAAPQ